MRFYARSNGSRPGQHWRVGLFGRRRLLLRRKIYAALQKALQEKGIDLFAPQLTIATGDPIQPVTTAS